MDKKVIDVWAIEDAMRKMMAADEMGLMFTVEKIDKRLFGVDGRMMEYTHQEHAYRITVYEQGDN